MGCDGLAAVNSGVAISGALSVGAGMAMFGVMEKLADKTKDYSHELAKLEKLGGPMGRQSSAAPCKKKAFEITQRLPAKVTDLFKLAGATNSMLGQEETMSVLEDMGRFGVVLVGKWLLLGNDARATMMMTTTTSKPRTAPLRRNVRAKTSWQWAVGHSPAQVREPSECR
jgi:hypothetical protein